MNIEDYNKGVMEFTYLSGGWIPVNQNAQELTNQTKEGEAVYFSEITKRDVRFHRCYFSLLNYIWGFMPDNFKKTIKKNDFYYFLKHLKGDYDVVFTFANGTTMVRYESISFGKMSQKRFEEYVREQLPYIYENVIGKYFKGEKYDLIIENIEDEFKKFFSVL